MMQTKVSNRGRYVTAEGSVRGKNPQRRKKKEVLEDVADMSIVLSDFRWYATEFVASNCY